jgi:hypothetical protein
MTDDDSETYYTEVGSLVGSSLSTLTIETDQGNTLFPVSIPSGYEIEDGQRVLLQYSVINSVSTVTNGLKVDVVSIQDFYMKNILMANDEVRDTLANDPVTIFSLWIGKDYLNLEFTFLGNDTAHYFDVVYDDEQQEKEDYVTLDFHHDANEDETYQRYRVLMSVPLEQFQVAGQDSVNIWFRADDELYTPQSFVYKYN